MITSIATSTLLTLSAQLVRLILTLWTASLPEITSFARHRGVSTDELLDLLAMTWDRRVTPITVARVSTLYARARNDAWMASERPTLTPVAQRERDDALRRYGNDVRQRLAGAGRHFTDTSRRSLATTSTTDVPTEQLTPTAGRIDRIAQTELHAAYNAGLYDELTALNMPVRKRWLAVNDDRTREAHRLADGQEVTLHDDFTVGGARLPYPGYVNGPPEQVINCRCSVGYVFERTGSLTTTAATSYVACGCDGSSVDGES